MPHVSITLPRPHPERVVLEGHYTRLEPLDVQLHAASLSEASLSQGAEDRFRYLPDEQPSQDGFMVWINRASNGFDPLFFGVIDQTNGRCEGRQALMRISPEHGVIEIGNVLWGPAIVRTRIATEALYLAASYVFDTLGYRRFEWKCDADNGPSRRAAIRFGFTFEGIFRQHLVVKGLNRDTAWFAMLDYEWPELKAGFDAWLMPGNFDVGGKQITRLRNDLR